MILVDFSQVAISRVMQAITISTKYADPSEPVVVSEHTIRHNVLNGLREIIRKHKQKYGNNIVIACDDRNYWRKQIFPYYKASRKKARENSGWDWELIFNSMALLKQELREHFPYKVIQVESCEADDIIGVLVHKYGTLGQEFAGLALEDRILIVSGDKDFAQLQFFDNVDQYSPSAGKFVIEKQPVTFLKKHIMKGDSGDGVPNFLSDDDTFTSGGRQKSLHNRSIAEWSLLPYESFCKDDRLLRNWKRNEKLVDLSQVPQDLKEKILNTYAEYKPQPRSKMFNYFVTYKLKELHSAISDF